MDKKLSRNDLCFCGSGKKCKKCHSDVHPDSRAANLIDMHRNIEEKVISYQEKTGFIPPCHKGCYSCCFDDFSISEVEIVK
ncbi:SEC-C metal-binding domain-containing protein [Bacillus atrophaeus]|uniref:SEC-C metal-binding domain-containing protein n=1 Tax=Bacillus atrophaeus TaxID=1452 RepID=UPI0009BA3916